MGSMMMTRKRKYSFERMNQSWKVRALRSIFSLSLFVPFLVALICITKQTLFTHASSDSASASVDLVPFHTPTKREKEQKNCRSAAE